MNQWKFIRNSIGLFGSAVHEGQTKTGTELAPRALREGGLISALYNLGWEINDMGDIQGKNYKINNVKSKFFKNSQQLGIINGEISKRAFDIVSKQKFMLNIGGDHSVACGSIHGLLEHYGDELRVVWVDAHADCNYQLDSNRNYHGMPLGHLYGAITEQIKGFEWLRHRLDTKNIIYVGIRDIDPMEREFIKDNKIVYYGMDEIIELGIGQVMTRILKQFEGKPIHVSFDVDSIDPEFAHGTGTLVDGGITSREVHYILRKLAASRQLVGMDLVEINPQLEKTPELREEFFGDFQQIGRIQGTQTVALGIELIASALGRTLVL
ncbi:unnamed protein product [Paramecium primaurelia]|uniref:Arginase n=1 Tax=Paramecium primaurelia TaxID=5886 RepID=A0A8S1MS94_PARPR|nr:unnamed protein product [Paramecium primaurelia]